MLTTIDFSEYCVCVYGSLSRENADQFSDCDVLVLSMQSDGENTPILPLSLYETWSKSGVIVSFRHLLSKYNNILTMRDLSVFKNLRYVAGDERLLDLAKAKYKQALLDMSLHSLVQMWRTDPYRSINDHHSLAINHISLKRGRGGVIDIDFVAIYYDWLSFRTNSIRASLTKLNSLREQLLSIISTGRAISQNKLNTWYQPLSGIITVVIIIFTTWLVRHAIEFELRKFTKIRIHDRRGKMDQILKALHKAYIPLALILIGGILLAISLLLKIPGSGGGEIVLRDSPHWISLSLGTVLLFMGFLSAVLGTTKTTDISYAEINNRRIQSAVNNDFKDLIGITQSEIAAKSNNMPSSSLLQNAADDKLSAKIVNPISNHSTQDLLPKPIEPGSPNYDLKIRSSYQELTPTQKMIMTYLIRIVHANEISVDDLTEGFNNKYKGKGKSVSSTSEMYYRLIQLQSYGFVRMQKVGERVTKVVKINEAGTVLTNGDLLDS